MIFRTIELYIDGERQPWREWNRSLVFDRCSHSIDDDIVSYYYLSTSAHPAHGVLPADGPNVV